MTIPTNQQSYTQGSGTSGHNNVAIPIFQHRAPTAQDINYLLGTTWIYTDIGAVYTLTSFSTFNATTTATWSFLGGSSGDLNTLTDESSVVVLPTAGTIIVGGTTNQITTSGTNAPGTMTIGLPNTMIAPGSLEVTGIILGDASATIQTAGTAMNLGSDDSGDTINIGNGSVARTINIGASNTAHQVTIGSGLGVAFTQIFGGTSGVSIGTSDGEFNVITGQGAINISDDDTDTAINIGTGNGSKTVTVGSTNGGALTTIQSGGSIVLSGSVVAINSITAQFGIVGAQSLRASGDAGGTAGEVTVSNIVNETLSTGDGTIKMTTANAGTSTGWLKIYNGVAARYIPYFTDIAP